MQPRTANQAIAIASPKASRKSSTVHRPYRPSRSLLLCHGSDSAVQTGVRPGQERLRSDVADRLVLWSCPESPSRRRSPRWAAEPSHNAPLSDPKGGTPARSGAGRRGGTSSLREPTGARVTLMVDGSLSARPVTRSSSAALHGRNAAQRGQRPALGRPRRTRPLSPQMVGGVAVHVGGRGRRRRAPGDAALWLGTSDRVHPKDTDEKAAVQLPQHPTYSLAGIASIRSARALRSAWPPARAPA